ncbi:hypothetical protein AB0P21_35550 [Kribbella sp. NPDC056861]|uniref:hypothetical protein n=1 Tax=Kribbella sp. NPDC056861 TaxID=3154857 RepID=UPI00341A63C3
MPATLLRLLAPRLLLVAGLTGLRRRRLTPTTSRRLSTLRRLTRLLAPATLLRGLTLTGLTMTGLLTGLRLSGLRRRLTPATTALAGLLSPATLAWLSTRLTPLLPARLAPRLPRTPRSLWRRSHMRSLETHV